MLNLKRMLLALAVATAINGCSGDTPPDTTASGVKSPPTTQQVTKPKPKPEITKPTTPPTKPKPKPDTKPTTPPKTKPELKPKPDNKQTAPKAFNLQSISPSSPTSQTTFSWEKSEGATSYTLCSKDETKPKFCHIVATTKETSVDVNGLGVVNSLTVPYFVIASNAQGVQLSNEKSITPQELTSLTQYIKASNTRDESGFGDALSLSSDGRTLAVGALWEASNATGINGDETDNSMIAGAVYLYRFDSGLWTQQAYLKASNTDDEDYFGSSVSLSSDGNTLAIGAPGEASNATGVNGNQADNSEAQSGAVYLFRFDSGVWLQQAYIKASETKANDNFGTSLALSSNGNTLAVGKYQQESVYLFQFDSGSWSQQAKLKGSNTEPTDNFGSSISLSSDGLTLAVGAMGESSNATGIDGDGTDNSEFGSGAVYIFRLDSGAWSQEAYIKASNTHSTDNFGSSVSLSSNGHTLAVGAKEDSSNATGVNGVQSDYSTPRSGAAYLFRFDSGTWSQQAYIKASTPDIRDNFGVSVSLSHDGNTLAVGAHCEASSATGVNGLQSDNSAPRSGAAYLFRFDSGVWSQQAYIKAPNAERGDNFGYSVSLSSDGKALAVGAAAEASNATGVNGNQGDNSASYSGAAYLY